MVKTLSTEIALGTPASAFDLPNTNPAYGGEQVSLSQYESAPALLLAFICNHCPYVVHLRDSLAAFAEKQAANGLAVIAISANDVIGYPDDSPENMTRVAAECGFHFPYLYDETQETAKAYGAVCTPDFFLYDGQRQLCYRGRYDDSTPGNGQPITGSDLENAVRATLAGQGPVSPQSPSVGCSIKWK